MKTSRVLCTRNRAGPLRQCLPPLVQADRPAAPMEGVIVDNGSTDGQLARLSSELLGAARYARLLAGKPAPLVRNGQEPPA